MHNTFWLLCFTQSAGQQAMRQCHSCHASTEELASACQDDRQLG